MMKRFIVIPATYRQLQLPTKGSLIPRQTEADDTVKIMLFKTATCPNCKAAEAILRKEGVDYVEIYADSEENRALVDEFVITNAPTLIVQKGNEIERYFGVSAIKGWLMKK